MPLKGISNQSSGLKALRVIVGWSRLHTSERIGVPEATLRRWEADDNAPAAYAKWIERMAQLALQNPPPSLPERHRSHGPARAPEPAAEPTGAAQVRAGVLIVDSSVQVLRKRLIDRASELRQRGNRADAALMSSAAYLLSYKRNAWTTDAISDVAVRYSAGESLQSIAEDIGCSVQTLSRQLRGAGVKVRPCGVVPGTVARSRASAAERYHAIAAMRNSGESLSEIGSKFHITRERVRQILAGGRVAGEEKSEPAAKSA